MVAEGEAQLRDLATRYVQAEARVRELIGEGGRDAVVTSLLLLAALRRLDAKGPVRVAYLTAFNNRARGEGSAVEDLAGSLAVKLDRAAQTASQSTREAFKGLNADNLEEMQALAVTAKVDADGKRWSLGTYAEMAAMTIGRRATTRGLIDAVGDGIVVVEGSSEDEVCGALIGWRGPASAAPQPPFHPNCTCALSSV